MFLPILLFLWRRLVKLSITRCACSKHKAHYMREREITTLKINIYYTCFKYHANAVVDNKAIRL